MKQSSHGLIGDIVPAVAERGWRKPCQYGWYLFIYFVHSVNEREESV